MFFLITVYVNAFFLGAVIMGFEMLGSRYLYPFFGGSIVTWAALISMVLAGLMAGYFIGGALADKFPSPRALGWIIFGAAVYLAAVPTVAGPLSMTIYNTLGDGSVAVLTAAGALLFAPILLLGVFSPYAVKLTLQSTHSSGRTAGRVYGISTFGSIFGTLFTTFTLIPVIGSRDITYVFAGCAAISACSFFIFKRREGL